MSIAELASNLEALACIKRRERPHKVACEVSIRLLTPINERWRVTYDDVQWILQYRNGGDVNSPKGWSGKSYCTTSAALIRCIREKCGVVFEDAIRRIQSLPESFKDWTPEKFRPSTHNTPLKGGVVVLEGAEPCNLRTCSASHDERTAI